jgi:hypothetical protein
MDEWEIVILVFGCVSFYLRPRLASNLRSSCHKLPNAGIRGIKPFFVKVSKEKRNKTRLT